MDEVLSGVAETIKNFAVIYLVDITEVPDFNTMYELYDPSMVMFFFRNKHITIDLGTGNNNKINWAMKDKQEFVDIVETVYRGARKGRGLVIAPKDYSTKYRYTESGAIHDLFGPVTNKEVCLACRVVVQSPLELPAGFWVHGQGIWVLEE
uniref:Thioredoxin-like protein 4A n=1 Tax=Aegilops tauschii TaxID=37682 RepID=M8ALH2_AEGTA